MTVDLRDFCFGKLQRVVILVNRSLIDFLRSNIFCSLYVKLFGYKMASKPPVNFEEYNISVTILLF